MRFRKRPIEVEAWQWTGEPVTRWPDWVQRLPAVFAEGGVIFLSTPRMQIRVERQHWVILGVIGDIYPCPPDIFSAIYDPLEDRAEIGLIDGGHITLTQHSHKGPIGDVHNLWLPDGVYKQGVKIAPLPAENG